MTRILSFLPDASSVTHKWRNPVSFLVCAAMLASWTLWLAHNATSVSMNVDEMEWTFFKVWHVGFMDMLRTLLTDGYNLPLYYAVLWAEVRVAGFNETLFYLPSIFAATAGVVFLGLAAKRLGGGLYAIVTMALCISCSFLIAEGAWQVRPYSFFFCFAALTMLCFIRRFQSPTPANIALYGVAMTLFLFTHWFACLLLLFYALADLALFAAGRVKLRCAASYLGAALVFAPWFVLVILRTQHDPLTYWVVPPHLTSVTHAFWDLSGSNATVVALLAAGALSVSCLFLPSLRREETGTAPFFLALFGLSVLWLLGVTFVYSRFINPTGSLFFDRYFFCLIAPVMLIAAYIPSRTLQALLSVGTQARPVFAAACGMFACVYAVDVAYPAYTSSYLYRWTEPYREAAVYLAAQSDALIGESPVIGTFDDSTTPAWRALYFDSKGLPAPRRFVSISGAHAGDGNDSTQLLDLSGVDKAYVSTIQSDRSLAQWDALVGPGFTRTQSLTDKGILVYERTASTP